MLRRSIMVILGILLLTACGGGASTNPTATAIPATSTTVPPPAPSTPTAVAIAVTRSPIVTSVPDELGSLLFQPGDLLDVEGGDITDEAGKIFESLPKPQKNKFQLLGRQKMPTGGVTVLIYDSAATAKTAYDMLAAQMQSKAQPVPGLGEAAIGMYSQNETTRPGAAHLFVRCRAMAYIVGDSDAFDPIQPSDWVNYAKRLDERLKGFACK